MKKLNKHILYLFIIAFTLNGCQSVKDGLTGQKRKNSDEFLIEKKKPLVLPADFDELPEPKILNVKEKNKEKEINLESIIKKSIDTKSISKSSNSSVALEKIILEKIKED